MTSILIFAYDCDNDQILVNLKYFSTSKLSLDIFNITTSQMLMTDENVENKPLLDLVSVLLEYAERDNYDLKDSDYRHFYKSFAESMFYLITASALNISWIYDEITLKVSKW